MLCWPVIGRGLSSPTSMCLRDAKPEVLGDVFQIAGSMVPTLYFLVFLSVTMLKRTFWLSELL